MSARQSRMTVTSVRTADRLETYGGASTPLSVEVVAETGDGGGYLSWVCLPMEAPRVGDGVDVTWIVS